MRTLFLLVTVFVGGACCAGEAQPWRETVQMFFVVQETPSRAILSATESALAEKGFTRVKEFDAVGSPNGIFAAYGFGTSASALVAEGKLEGCIMFLATNSDKAKEGLIVTAGRSVESKLRSTFGAAIKFFSDQKCANAL